MNLAARVREARPARETPERQGPVNLPEVGPAPAAATSAFQLGLGNQALQQLLRSGGAHAKLAVGSPDDPLEKQADAVAERVTRTPTPLLRRKCDCGVAAGASGVCGACGNERTAAASAVRRRTGDGGGPSEAPPIVHQVLRGGGRPLDAPARVDMERRFGDDFTDVRIHTGPEAAESARSVGALAYAVGPHIAFAEGRYAPQSEAGRRLLAHELVHVAQDSARGGAPVSLRRQPPPDGGAPPAPTSAGPPAPTSAGPPAPTAAGPPAPGPQNAEPAPPAATGASAETQSLVDAALKSQDPADVKKIKSFAGVSDAQKLQLIGILLNQAWVGAFDEWSLEAIWGSFGDRVLTVASSAIGLGLWQSSIERGADLDDLPVIQKVRAAFPDDVTALARGYLDSNDALVVAEAAAAGINIEEMSAVDDPSERQKEQTEEMQAAAEAVAHVQDEMERSRQIYVGYSLRNVPPEAKQYWLPVTFDPFRPPQRPDEPVIDPNDPSPMAEHHHVLHPDGPVTLQPYETVLDAYKMGLSAVRVLTGIYPLLYAIAREGKPAATQAFARAAVPDARDQLGTALRKLRADITQAKGKLGGDLNPLDLAPLHEQLFQGTAGASATNWTLALTQQEARDLTKGHDVHNALVALGLEAVSELAFMIGGVVPGAGGVFAAVIGLAASGIKSGISSTQYQAMLQASKTAVAPGTELVTEGQVDEAKARAEADQAALALAAVNAAAAIAGAASSWAGERIAEAQRSAAPGEPQPAPKALPPKEAAEGPAKINSGDAIEVVDPAPPPAAPPGAPAKPYSFRVVTSDPESGEMTGVVIDNASKATGTFRINMFTRNGVVESGGEVRAVVDGVVQPARAALPLVASPDAAPAQPGEPPSDPGSTPSDPGSPPPGALPPGPDGQQPKQLPGGAPTPKRLPPAGGFDNAFPAQEPFGTAAEPNIGALYPGMRQLPAGYPGYDFVRGGRQSVEFSTEKMGTPRARQTVLTLTVEGGEWLSAKTVLDAKDATPEHITDVVDSALKDMETKSGRKAQYDPAHNWYVRVEAASPERVILDIHVPGEARAQVPALQTAAEQAVKDSGWSPGVPVEVRVMSWR